MRSIRAFITILCGFWAAIPAPAPAQSWPTGKPITIVDLSGVPSEIVDIVVSLLSRIVFDFAVWSEPVQTLPVLLVCEEAQDRKSTRLNSSHRT